MLSREDNERLTRTGRETPCGLFMRKYWHPVALSEELSSKNATLPVRILGEDLVLFRSQDSRLALIGRYCPHRRTDLSYGRIEANGLRCLYHGWLMGLSGGCLEQPGEPATSTYAAKIKHPSYPCMEKGGIIFAFLGTGEPPTFPAFECLDADPSTYYVTKQHHHCNYMQGLEGYLDPQHLSFLHRFANENSPDLATTSAFATDVAPSISVEEAGFGLRIYSVRKAANAGQYVRITNFVLPNCGAFVGDPVVDPSKNIKARGYSLNWAVPIDDHNHFKYVVNYRIDGPIDLDYMQRVYADIDRGNNYTTPRNAANRYMQDRASMDRIFSGMGENFFDHDKFAVESMGPVVDRSLENLASTDRAIIAARRRLLSAIEDAVQGRDVPGATHDHARNPLADMVVCAEMIAADQTPESLLRQPTPSAV